MNKIKIKFSSVTYALKAKEILENNGKKVIVRKSSNNSKSNGCGYVLIVTGNIDKSISLLNINHVKYIGYEMI